MKTNYVVRIVLPDDVHELTPLLHTLLCLFGQVGSITVHRDDQHGMCFDLLPPAGEESWEWANQAVQLFLDYGFNAVRAPECPK